MYFRNGTKTDIIDSILRLYKEGGINDVSRKFMVIRKILVSYCLEEQFIRKASFITYQIEGQCLY